MSTAAKAESSMSNSNPAASWASFSWEDPFRLEQQLTDDERLVMDTARQYAQDRLAPRVQQAYRDEQTDPAQDRQDEEHYRRQGFHDHFNHMRSFVLGDEAGLLMATYPRCRSQSRTLTGAIAN